MGADRTAVTSLRLSGRWALGLCSLLLVLRLASLPLYPLLDRTESRYSEIAREMVVTADWVTPRVHGESFWAKPPLATWCTAAGLGALGRNELAARLPAYAAGILTLLLVWRLGVALGGRVVAATGQQDPLWERVRREPEHAAVVTKHRRMDRIPPDIRSRLRLQRDFDGRYQTWTLGGSGRHARTQAPPTGSGAGAIAPR